MSTPKAFPFSSWFYIFILLRPQNIIFTFKIDYLLQFPLMYEKLNVCKYKFKISSDYKAWLSENFICIGVIIANIHVDL